MKIAQVIRRRGATRLGVFALLSITVLLVSCAPPRERFTARQTTGQQAAAQQQQAPKVKTMRMGMANEEPNGGIAVFNGASAGEIEPIFIFHAGLTIYGTQGLQAHLAQKIPSLDDGDWKVFPDGKMEVTWSLRPGIMWHDGAPLTADDFVLGLRVVRDNDLPINRWRGIRSIDTATAPSPDTLVVTWKSSYIEANQSGPVDIPAAPVHIMEGPLQRLDKNGITNHPYWAREFVGLGPYKMGEWATGSYIEAIAFDDFFLGKPKIDRIIIRYFADINTAMANVLSDEIDFVPGGTLKNEHALTLKRQWEATGRGTVTPLPNKLRQLELQWRDTNAPWMELRVRQAIAHLIDRQTIVDTLAAGLTDPADIPITRSDPLYAVAERVGFAKYPYDPSRGRRLLADAGWTQSAEGTPVRNASGTALYFDVAGTGSSASSPEAQEAQAIADQLKAEAGFDSHLYFVFEDAADVNEYRTKFRGGLVRSISTDPIAQFETYLTSNIASERDRYRGRNRGGYSNRTLDSLFDQASTTLDTNQRNLQFAELVKLTSEQVSFVPIYYGFDIAAVGTGIRGLRPTPAVQRATVWNIYAWEMN